METMRDVAMVYAAGVVVGLWRTDAPPAARIAPSLLWPIGPLAGVVTITGLLVAAGITPLLRAR
jgi:hypothetical protein